jgi:hypothetical protein
MLAAWGTAMLRIQASGGCSTSFVSALGSAYRPTRSDGWTSHLRTTSTASHAVFEAEGMGDMSYTGIRRQVREVVDRHMSLWSEAEAGDQATGP